MFQRTKDVTLVDYDPSWVERFGAIRDRLGPVLGDYAAGVEHVGSTAVPGMPAKDVVDIDVVIRRSEDLAFVVERLAEIGYVYLGDLGIAGREAFGAPLDWPRHNLYVCAIGAQELLRHLAFRDALRADGALAQQYAELKRELAARFPHDVDTYAEEKSPFIIGVLHALSAQGNRRRTTPRP